MTSIIPTPVKDIFRGETTPGKAAAQTGAVGAAAGVAGSALVWSGSWLRGAEWTGRHGIGKTVAKSGGIGAVSLATIGALAALNTPDNMPVASMAGTAIGAAAGAALAPAVMSIADPTLMRSTKGRATLAGGALSTAAAGAVLYALTAMVRADPSTG